MSAPVLEPKPSLRQRLAAQTPEEADRRRFGLWALSALIVLLPLWWFLGADLAAAALRPLASAVLGLFGLTGGIAIGPDHSWMISTGLPLADGSGRDLVYGVTDHTVRRLLVSVPLFLAFMIAPPRTDRPVRAVLIGLAVLVVLFLASLTAFVWGEIAPMLNPALAGYGTEGTQRVAAPPLSPLAAQVALIGRYLALSVAPLIVTVVLWAALNPRGRAALLGALEPQAKA